MVLLLYKFTIFSFFLIILENIWQSTAAGEIDQNNSDGEQFIEKVVNGEKTVFEKPEYLLFTAPYKICEGGCPNDEGNFAMEFPLFIGKKGLARYTDFYQRDHKKIHSGRPNAPLKKRSTKKLFTLCPTSTCTITATTEKTDPSTEEDNLTPTTQETTTEESSSTTNGSASDGKDHDNETETESSTQTTFPSTSNYDFESKSSQTNFKKCFKTIKTQPMKLREKHDYSAQAEQNQIEVECNTTSERTSDYNDIQGNTYTVEVAEITGELEHGDEPINSNENTQIEENTATSEEIHESQTMNLKDNTQKDENIDFLGITQYGNEYTNNNEIITDIIEDTQNEIDTINSKENIQTQENLEALGVIEHADESMDVHNIKELNDQLNNSHKLKLEINKSTNGDDYKRTPLFRPMFTSITNAMGEICPFYVCSKMVKPDTDKLELKSTKTRDQFYRDVTDIDEKIVKKDSYVRRDWQNEIADNSKFEHQRSITTGVIEHADESIDVHNIKELNDQHNNFLYNHAQLNNSHKVTFEINKSTNEDAYKRKLPFRPMFTSITNAMGEICPFYVCNKMFEPDTDKLEVKSTNARDQFYRDVTDIDEKIDKKDSYARRGWQNEISDNSKFEHQRSITAANNFFYLNQRKDQINELEEFPSYSDDNGRNKNYENLRVQSNAEDEFESYSDDTYEDKRSNFTGSDLTNENSKMFQFFTTFKSYRNNEADNYKKLNNRVK